MTSLPSDTLEGGGSGFVLAERLSHLIRKRTVAVAGGAVPDDRLDEVPGEESVTAFAGLQRLLREWYPLLFRCAETELVGTGALLLRVPHAPAPVGGVTGTGAVLLMAHQDVVPAPTAGWREAGWRYPPFDGVIADESGAKHVFGRGALDDKGSLLVLLEAVEALLSEGWRPSNDLYLYLGCDEEVDGPSAVAACQLLRERGVRFDFVLDEGGAVASGAVPGLRGDMAVIGIAEKGSVDLQITVQADPSRAGHASTPPRRSVAAALGRAVAALEAHPHPANLDDVAAATLTTLAAQMKPPLSWVLRRAERLRPLLAAALPRLGGELAAMVRTTMVTTSLGPSGAHNVMPSRMSAWVNMRVLPGSTVQQAVGHVERVVRRAVGNGGPAAQVTVVSGSEPVPASPMDERWEAVAAAARHAYPDAVPTPYTMLAASDSRHFAPLADAIYRFSPLRMDAAQRASIHGVDERVSVDSLVRGVAFYRVLLSGGAAPTGSGSPAASQSPGDASFTQ